MESECKLSCPHVNNNLEIRTEILKETIFHWFCNESFVNLIELFGGAVPGTESLKEQIDYLNDFAEIWDYRKKKANGGERWLVQEDQFLSDHRHTIMECMTNLGFRDVITPIEKPDYILPLGGARMANLDRCLAAMEVCRRYQRDSIPVVALTGMRPISDIEKASLEQYAPNAKTEYEAMCGGIEKAFGLPVGFCSENIHMDENINLSWAERHYDDARRSICVLSAPSLDPGRRANSMDTFKFFMEKYKLDYGTRILLVTSCIYVPFQLMKFTALALEKGIYVECIGNKDYEHTPTVLNTASYLQELKATINAIKSLSDLYF